MTFSVHQYFSMNNTLHRVPWTMLWNQKAILSLQLLCPCIHQHKMAIFIIRLFGLLSSSLLYSHFSWYVLQPSSSIYQTWAPTRNFGPPPLFKQQGSLVLILLTITRYKYSCFVTRLQSGLNLQPPDDYLFRRLENQCL